MRAPFVGQHVDVHIPMSVTATSHRPLKLWWLFSSLTLLLVRDWYLLLCLLLLHGTLYELHLQLSNDFALASSPRDPLPRRHSHLGSAFVQLCELLAGAFLCFRSLASIWFSFDGYCFTWFRLL